MLLARAVQTEESTMTIDIRKPLKRLLPHLLKAQEENLNEADTSRRVVKVFEEVLGYDAMTEITSEKQIKEKYVDIAIKIDGAIRLLVETKAAGVTLRDRHIEQAERYAAEGNIRWVVLTNGIAWNLYHLSFGEGIEYERAFSLNLTTDPFDTVSELLGLLHRQSIRKGDHEVFWQCRAALSPKSIGKALFAEEVIRFIRREIRKHEGILIDEEDLANAIHGMFSVEAREQIGPLRIRRKRVLKAEKPATPTLTPSESTPTSEPNITSVPASLTPMDKPDIASLQGESGSGSGLGS